MLHSSLISGEREKFQESKYMLLCCGISSTGHRRKMTLIKQQLFTQLSLKRFKVPHNIHLLGLQRYNFQLPLFLDKDTKAFELVEIWIQLNFVFITLYIRITAYFNIHMSLIEQCIFHLLMVMIKSLLNNSFGKLFCSDHLRNRFVMYYITNSGMMIETNNKESKSKHYTLYRLRYQNPKHQLGWARQKKEILSMTDQI